MFLLRLERAELRFADLGGPPEKKTDFIHSLLKLTCSFKILLTYIIPGHLRTPQGQLWTVRDSSLAAWTRRVTGLTFQYSYSPERIIYIIYGELILFCSGIGMKRLLALPRLDIFTDDWTKRSGSRLVRL